MMLMMAFSSSSFLSSIHTYGLRKKVERWCVFPFPYIYLLYFHGLFSVQLCFFFLLLFYFFLYWTDCGKAKQHVSTWFDDTISHWKKIFPCFLRNDLIISSLLWVDGYDETFRRTLERPLYLIIDSICVCVCLFIFLCHEFCFYFMRLLILFSFSCFGLGS